MRKRPLCTFVRSAENARNENGDGRCTNSPGAVTDADGREFGSIAHCVRVARSNGLLFMIEMHEPVRAYKRNCALLHSLSLLFSNALLMLRTRRAGRLIIRCIKRCELVLVLMKAPCHFVRLDEQCTQRMLEA